MTAILEARNLHKQFGAVTAANDICASINQHSVVGLIGTNGAGKTTFVNMVTGYLKPSSGSILFAGRDITSLAPRDITRLGIAGKPAFRQVVHRAQQFGRIQRLVDAGLVPRLQGLL